MAILRKIQPGYPIPEVGIPELVFKKRKWWKMIHSSPFKETKGPKFIPVPGTNGEFAHPEPWPVSSNSRVWHKEGIGVA